METVERVVISCRKYRSQRRVLRVGTGGEMKLTFEKVVNQLSPDEVKGVVFHF